MYTNLEHLSSLEVDKIKKRYYNGESVAKLIAEYQLNIAPAFLYKLLPPDTVKKWGCGRCRVNLVVDSVARSGSQQMTDPMRFYCPVCRRRPFRDNHGWVTFPLLSDDEIMQKQEIIKAHYGKPIKPVNYASLSFSSRIYLAALCLGNLDRDGYTIRPYNRAGIELTSLPGLQQTIYKSLMKDGVITISPDTPLEVFDLNAKSFPRKYDPDKVLYRLNVSLPANVESIFDLINTPIILREESKEEFLELWKEIAIGECISYLQQRFERISFPFSPGQKTYSVFRQLLEYYSPAQIYYIIWCKVNDASRLYLEGGISKPHAANTVIGACLRYGEDVAFFKRELPQFKYPTSRPRSFLTQYFYNKILKLGPEADNVRPCILPDLFPDPMCTSEGSPNS